MAKVIQEALVKRGDRRKEWGFQSELDLDQWILTKVPTTYVLGMPRVHMSKKKLKFCALNLTYQRNTHAKIYTDIGRDDDPTFFSTDPDPDPAQRKKVPDPHPRI